jgi:hypothetical protein
MEDFWYDFTSQAGFCSDSSSDPLKRRQIKFLGGNFVKDSGIVQSELSEDDESKTVVES